MTDLTALRSAVDFWMAQAHDQRSTYPHHSYGPSWDTLVDGAVGVIGRIIDDREVNV